VSWSTRPLLAGALVTVAACTSRSAATAPSHLQIVLAAPSTTAARASDDPDPGWPRTIADNGWRITAHQPQIERLDGERLTARVAVALEPPHAPPLYAVFGMHARAAIDKHHRLVVLDDVSVDHGRYAPPSDQRDEADAAVAGAMPRLMTAIALDRLVAELVAERAHIDDRTVHVANVAPRIFVADKLAVLVPIDGTPVWRRASATFDRLVNTRALVLLDRARRWVYLYLGDTWYRSRSLEGDDWRTATLLPPDLEPIRARLAAEGRVDLLDAPGSPLSRALAVGRVPHIFVSAAPAEVIAFDGAPQLERIGDTTLSFVANSHADLFADHADDRWYVLLSGRWFRARLLAGPWEFVPAGALPRDFARIPVDHVKARVLSAVRGTPLAAEALVSNEVPDTAVVRVADAKLDVRYDGAPRFASLAGTLFRYAVNSATPVIEVSAPLGGDGLYYALADGIWFTATSAAGPWRVASAVPASIYDIPPSAPLHFVRYVRVYGGDDKSVRVGYTPGYFGTCRGDDDVVVFGTGYEQPPYVGNSWIGRPATYGFAARWEPGVGWTLGNDQGSARATYRPWWQPALAVVAAADAEPFADERADLYAHSNRAVARPVAPAGEFQVPSGGDELFAGSDGGVYRARGGAWERYADGSWRPAPLGSEQASARGPLGRDELAALDRDRDARRIGQARWDLYRELSALP
jgi:hypothetical protein